MNTTRLLAASVAAGSMVLLLAGCTASQPQADTPSTSTPTPAPTVAQAPTPSPDQTERNEQLIAAAWANDLEQVSMLIAAGADVNAKDATAQSAYLIATSEGYLPLLELTLQHGADVTSLDSWNGTGLIRASERGHAGVAGRLIQANIDVDHVNNLGWVALHEALVFAQDARAEAYIDTVRVLVAGGADVSIPTQRDSQSPTELATSGGLAPQAQLIQAALDADPLAQNVANERLLNAASTGDADCVALALRAGAEMETRNGLDQTALLLAATEDHVDVARLLVALGADPDALDHQHDTPWLVTGVTGSVAMVEALLPANPDMSIPNRYGGLSPIPAGEHGHADYIARVALTDIDLDHVNNLGWTALLEAVIFGDGSQPYQDIVNTLIEAGADINLADRDGVTALQHAQAKGFTEIARALESAGGR